MIYIAADHAGFELKERIKKYLAGLKEKFEDLGVDSDQPVDYPDYAASAAKKIQTDPKSQGILICGTGQGICIAANKFIGLRAAQAWSADVARAGRNDDDINALCLAARHQSFEDVKPIIKAFLETPFEKIERRIRRLNKISKLEKIKN